MEDLIGRSRNAIWVIDGATGLGDKQYTDAPTDGVWYVREFDELLQSRIEQHHLPLDKIIAEAVATISTKFENIAGEKSRDPLNEPSAAIAVVRWSNDALEYFVLGDASVVFKSPDGRIDAILGEGPRMYDREVVSRIERAMERGLSHSDARAQVRPLLEENRRRKNTAGGYWTLGFSTEAVSAATMGEKQLRDWSRAYLFTDGFERIVTTFDIFDDWTEATDYIDREGIESAFDVLRTTESRDADCTQYPRIKQSDDAALATTSFEATAPSENTFNRT